MFKAKILSGIWEEETIILKGMPRDFVLSARNLIVLETEEYTNLQAENKRLKKTIGDLRAKAVRKTLMHDKSFTGKT